MNALSLPARCRLFIAVILIAGLSAPAGEAAELAQRLLTRSPEFIAAQTRMRGDSVRGSVIFHASAAGCIKCHSDGSTPSPLGPKLTDISREVTDAYLIEAILRPSRTMAVGRKPSAMLFSAQWE